MSEAMFLKKWLNLPENLRKQVEDFMDFLATKNAKNYKNETEKPKRKLGLGKGMVILMPNFDDPIEGFEEYM